MNLFKNLISLFIVFILFLSYKILPSIAIGNVEWILLKENQDGKEWLDLGSLKKINKNEISVLTKFEKKSNKNNKVGNTSLYVMRINCFNKKFKDTSINGIPNFNSKWQDTNKDELIEVVIQKACLEEGF
tara:strand:+ start:1010 stop:1399 length:390 start_codon:yes stop_codon:yes gene_type:complete